MATATSRTPELSTEEWKKAVCALFTNVQLYGKLPQGIKQILQNKTYGQTFEEGKNWYYNPSVTALYEMYPEGVIARVFFTEKEHAEENFLKSRSVEEYRRSVEEHRRSVEEHLRSVEEHLRSVEEHLRSVKKYQRSVEERRRSVEEHQGSVEEHQGSVEEHQGSVEEHQGSVEKYQRSVEHYLRPVHSIGLNYSPCTIEGHECARKIVEKYEDKADKPKIHFSQVYKKKGKQPDHKKGINLLIADFELKVLDTEPIFEYLLKQAPTVELQRQLEQVYESTADPRSQRDKATQDLIDKCNEEHLANLMAGAKLTEKDGKSKDAYKATSKKKGSVKEQNETGRDKSDKKVRQSKTAQKN